MSGMNLVDVNAANLDQCGFFCRRSRSRTAGNRATAAWLKERFGEGLRIKLAPGGFVEYVPGEQAWRAVRAPGYTFVQCLWVVGQNKGKGAGTRLMAQVEAEARAEGRHGVAVVCSSKPWMVDAGFFRHLGYASVDEAPPSFELLVKQFGDHPLPSFPTDWDARIRAFGDGLTVVYADQCPYMGDAVAGALLPAKERGLEAQVVKLETAREVQERAPSAYGVFSVLCGGRLFSYYYLDGKAQAELGRLLDGGR